MNEIVNVCIIEPSAVKTNFDGHSKARITPHEAYAAPDMPARMLESYVNKGLAAGGGMEPAAVAERIYEIASRGEKVPLRVPLGGTAWSLAKAKFEGSLKELEMVKGLSEMGENI